MVPQKLPGVWPAILVTAGLLVYYNATEQNLI